MRPWTFLIFAFLALALETGLRTLWIAPIGAGVAPSLMLVLMVFIALWAPPLKVAWAALVLGLLLDLSHPWPVYAAVRDVAIPGPMALGFLVGAYVVLQFRSVVFRDSSVSVAALVLVGGLFVHLVAVALLTLRGVPLPVVAFLGGAPVANWSPADQLWQRFLTLLYSALAALPVGWLLVRTMPWWAFDLPRGPTR